MEWNSTRAHSNLTESRLILRLFVTCCSVNVIWCRCQQNDKSFNKIFSVISSAKFNGKNPNRAQTTTYGGPYLPRQNLLFHGKTYFSTAKRTFPRQNLLFHGKTYFITAKLTFSRQNLLFHGKTYFSTAKLTFSRQNLLPASSLSVSTAPRH